MSPGVRRRELKYGQEADKYYNKLLAEIQLLKRLRITQNDHCDEIVNLQTQIEKHQLEQENLQTQIENQKQIYEETLKAINNEMDKLITEN